MSTWPEDHPGRNCATCGTRQYPIWVGDTPPPGTCPNDSGDALACDIIRGRIVSAHGLSEMMGKPVHEQTLALMQRLGITAEHVAAWTAESESKQRDEHDLRWSKAPGSKELGAWIGAGGNARVLAVIEWALQSYDISEGREVDMIEMGENQNRLARRLDLLVSTTCYLEPE